MFARCKKTIPTAATDVYAITGQGSSSAAATIGSVRASTIDANDA